MQSTIVHSIKSLQSIVVCSTIKIDTIIDLEVPTIFGFYSNNIISPLINYMDKSFGLNLIIKLNSIRWSTILMKLGQSGWILMNKNLF